MKKIMALVMVTALAAGLIACGKKEDKQAETAATEAAASTAATEAAAEASSDTETGTELKEEVYESKDGWKVRYYPAEFKLNTENKGEVSFSYQGEAAGSDVVTFSYHPGKMPNEVLYEKTADIDDSKVTRSEGYFYYPNWSYTRVIEPGVRGSGLGGTLIAMEHNGGTLLIDVLYHEEKDEERNMTISDSISGLLDSIEFTNHEPQRELDYVPGTYVREYEEEIEGENTKVTDKVVLKDDHSGVISFQDDIDIIWSSYELMGTETDYRTEYTVEGDILYVLDCEDWIQFNRQE